MFNMDAIVRVDDLEAYVFNLRGHLIKDEWMGDGYVLLGCSPSFEKFYPIEDGQHFFHQDTEVYFDNRIIIDWID